MTRSKTFVAIGLTLLFVSFGAIGCKDKEKVSSPKDLPEGNFKSQSRGKYEAVGETNVRSGPGVKYPVVAKTSKGTKLNVVED